MIPARQAMLVCASKAGRCFSPPSKRQAGEYPNDGLKHRPASLARASGYFVLGIACTAVSAFAADDSQVIFPGGTVAAAPGPADPSGGTFNTVTLFLAVLLAIAGAWVYWRNCRNPGLNRGTNALAIEETKALGSRQYLVVASYEGKRFLLGVCPGKIDYLAPLGEREERGP